MKNGPRKIYCKTLQKLGISDVKRERIKRSTVKLTIVSGRVPALKHAFHFNSLVRMFDFKRKSHRRILPIFNNNRSG